MSNKLTGINPLSYVGVNATTPPQLLTSKVNPTDKDFYNYSLGTQWLNETTQELWVLLDVAPKHTNRWGRIFPEASGGTNFYVTESGTAVSIASTLNVLGGTSVITTGVSDILTIDLANDISISGNATFGGLAPGGFVRANSSGELVSLADPTANGKVLISSASGAPAWQTLTAGANVSITNGANSITISASGGGGGGSLTFTGDTGTATADAGAMAIDGDSGNITTAATGSGATAKITISMADSPTFSTTTTTSLVLNGAEAGVLSCDSGGVVSTSKGTDGQVLIGSSSGVPEWQELSEGANVYINSESHGITIGTEIAIKGDTGQEDILLGLFEVSGDGGNITTAVGVDGTTTQVTISMDSSPTFSGTLTAGTIHTGDITVTNQDTAGVALFDEYGTLTSSAPAAKGKVLISSSAGAPAWENLTAGANISITNSDNGITIAAGGGGGGDLTFTTDSGSVTATAGTIAVKGDSGNITTSALGSGATAEVKVSLTSTPDFSDVSTVNLEVSGQPTFSNIGKGVIVSALDGTLSALKPTADGTLMIGSSTGTYAWNALTAGAGIDVTNTANHISISTPAPTIFTGTSPGSATTAGSLKILGDLGNITTTASGTGATAQVLIAMATSPTFTTVNATTVSTATLTASGTTTLSGLTAGLVKSSGAGVLSNTAPTAAGQVLIGAADGSMAWGTIAQGSNIAVTNGANSISIAVASSPSFSTLTASTKLVASSTFEMDSTIGTGGMLIANKGTGYVTSLAATSGAVPIGSTDGTIGWHQLTQGSNISITSADGSITIAATGAANAFTWSPNGNTSITGVSNNGYVLTNMSSGTVTVTLPTSPAVGDIVAIIRVEPGITNIAQSTSTQKIYLSSTPTTAGKGHGVTCASSTTYRKIELLCYNATGNRWVASDIAGSWTTY